MILRSLGSFTYCQLPQLGLKLVAEREVAILMSFLTLSLKAITRNFYLFMKRYWGKSVLMSCFLFLFPLFFFLKSWTLTGTLRFTNLLFDLFDSYINSVSFRGIKKCWEMIGPAQIREINITWSVHLNKGLKRDPTNISLNAHQPNTTQLRTFKFYWWTFSALTVYTTGVRQIFINMLCLVHIAMQLCFKQGLWRPTQHSPIFPMHDNLFWGRFFVDWILAEDRDVGWSWY